MSTSHNNVPINGEGSSDVSGFPHTRVLYYSSNTTPTNQVTPINSNPITGTNVPTDYDASADNSNVFQAFNTNTGEIYTFNPSTGIWHGRLDVEQLIPAGESRVTIQTPIGYSSADYYGHRVEELIPSDESVNTDEDADITGANVVIDITSPPNAGNTHSLITTFKK